MIAVIFAIVLFLPLPAAEAQQHIDTSIRSVNWESLLAHDTIDFLSDSLSSPDEQRPYYTLRNILSTKGSYQVDGWLDAADYPIRYTDLNQDGREDAVVSSISPGSGGWGASLIFLQTLHGPKYVGSCGGSHYWDAVHSDTLFIYTSHFITDLVSKDPECCYRAWDVQRIVGTPDSIHFLPLFVEPRSGTAFPTVDRFYSLINAGSPKLAYSMLSKSYQVSHPYHTWLKDFANTVSVKATADETSPDSAVRVKITSRDSMDGRIVTNLYAGVWHMKFVTNNLPDGDTTATADWFLDKPEIREVK